MTEQKKRIDKLKSSLIKNDGEALLITSNTNVYYCTGFNNSEGAAVITSKGAYLLVDFRYYEAAKKAVNSCEVVMFKSYYKDLTAVLSDNGVKTVYFETKQTTVFEREKLKTALSKAGIKLSSDFLLDTAIENLRLIKSETELGFIERAQQIAEYALADTLPMIKPGVTEKDVKLELEYKIKKQGAEDVSFDLITVTGKKTSLPHGVPGKDVIHSGDFFTLDIGAVYKGYHSDMTRTVAVGKISDEMLKVYNIVREAQSAALNMIRPGVSCRDVDKAARDIIEKAGYGKCFAHSTGHGVGLDIHESPALSPGSDKILSRGMVVTAEPGIYIEDCFGVRIEDMVCVTSDGFHNFVHTEKSLMFL